MKKILIVEDQPEIRELIRISLEQEEVQMHEAADADAAWPMVQEMRPDLVLLDIMMPGRLNGLQLCQMVKRDPQLKRTRVVMLTARGMPADVKAGKDAGADDYLVKPFSPLNLIRTAQRCLR